MELKITKITKNFNPINQNKFMINTLIFAGGGVKALSYVGALQELRDALGLDFGARTPHPFTIVGVSIGTLFALMIAIGLNVAEITYFVSTMQQSDVLNTDITRLFNNELSIDDGSKLRLHIKKVFAMKLIPISFTFLQLFQKYNVSLHIVVTDITNNCIEIINENNHPNLSVIDAMVASMSLPVIYSPFKSPSGNMWIDGGVLNNFPINYYDKNCNEIIGFDIVTSNEFKIDTLSSLLQRVLKVSRSRNDELAWNSIPDELKKRCVVIDTGNLSGLLNLNDISFDVRNKLLNAGKNAIKEWLKTHPYI